MRDFFGCYLLNSKSTPHSNRTYIGFTVNPRRRIRQHNGEITSGAARTKSWRPWEMVLVLYGFPTQVQALQFEWAWQHPEKSKIVRSVAARLGAVGMKGPKGKVRLLLAMLHEAPWKFFPLTLQFLSSESAQLMTGLPRPPAHMSVLTASIHCLPEMVEDAQDPDDSVAVAGDAGGSSSSDSGSSTSGSEDEVEGGLAELSQDGDHGLATATGVVTGAVAPAGGVPRCAVCEALVYSHIMTCTACSAAFHVECLGDRWAEVAGGGGAGASTAGGTTAGAMQDHGKCPACQHPLRWMDLLNGIKRHAAVTGSSWSRRNRKPKKVKRSKARAVAVKAATADVKAPSQKSRKAASAATAGATQDATVAAGVVGKPKAEKAARTKRPAAEPMETTLPSQGAAKEGAPVTGVLPALVGGVAGAWRPASAADEAVAGPAGGATSPDVDLSSRLRAILLQRAGGKEGSGGETLAGHAAVAGCDGCAVPDGASTAGTLGAAAVTAKAQRKGRPKAAAKSVAAGGASTDQHAPVTAEEQVDGDVAGAGLMPAPAAPKRRQNKKKTADGSSTVGVPPVIGLDVPQTAATQAAGSTLGGTGATEVQTLAAPKRRQAKATAALVTGEAGSLGQEAHVMSPPRRPGRPRKVLAAAPACLLNPDPAIPLHGPDAAGAHTAGPLWFAAANPPGAVSQTSIELLDSDSDSSASLGAPCQHRPDGVPSPAKKICTDLVGTTVPTRRGRKPKAAAAIVAALQPPPPAAADSLATGGPLLAGACCLEEMEADGRLDSPLASHAPARHRVAQATGQAIGPAPSAAMGVPCAIAASDPSRTSAGVQVAQVVGPSPLVLSLAERLRLRSQQQQEHQQTQHQPQSSHQQAVAPLCSAAGPQQPQPVGRPSQSVVTAIASEPAAHHSVLAGQAGSVAVPSKLSPSPPRHRDASACASPSPPPPPSGFASSPPATLSPSPALSIAYESPLAGCCPSRPPLPVSPTQDAMATDACDGATRTTVRSVTASPSVDAAAATSLPSDGWLVRSPSDDASRCHPKNSLSLRPPDVSDMSPTNFDICRSQPIAAGHPASSPSCVMPLAGHTADAPLVGSCTAQATSLASPCAVSPVSLATSLSNSPTPSSLSSGGQHQRLVHSIRALRVSSPVTTSGAGGMAAATGHQDSQPTDGDLPAPRNDRPVASMLGCGAATLGCAPPATAVPEAGSGVPWEIDLCSPVPAASSSMGTAGAAPGFQHMYDGADASAASLEVPMRHRDIGTHAAGSPRAAHCTSEASASAVALHGGGGGEQQQQQQQQDLWRKRLRSSLVPPRTADVLDLADTPHPCDRPSRSMPGSTAASGGASVPPVQSAAPPGASPMCAPSPWPLRQRMSHGGSPMSTEKCGGDSVAYNIDDVIIIDDD